jgi:hypothetical protein
MNFPYRKKILAIIVYMQCNNNSNKINAKNLRVCIDTSSIFDGKCIILSDDKELEDCMKDVYIVESRNAFVKKLNDVVIDYSKEYDILFTIQNSEENFIRVGEDNVTDFDIRDALYNNMYNKCYSLCLVETNKKGSMLDLMWKCVNSYGKVFKENDKRFSKNMAFNSFCISVCTGSNVPKRGFLIDYFLKYIQINDKVQISNFYAEISGVVFEHSGVGPILSRF